MFLISSLSGSVSFLCYIRSSTLSLFSWVLCQLSISKNNWTLINFKNKIDIRVAGGLEIKKKKWIKRLIGTYFWIFQHCGTGVLRTKLSPHIQGTAKTKFVYSCTARCLSSQRIAVLPCLTQWVENFVVFQVLYGVFHVLHGS